MESSCNWLTMRDGQEIFTRQWHDPLQKPKAIVQIAHGMAEHISRYEQFAAFLVERGIFVVGNDHRGHGETGQRQTTLGYFADESGFDKAAEDLYEVTGNIKKQYPDTPVILLGHSMGSFLTRRYLQTHSSSVHATILSGTGAHPGIANSFGKLLAKVEIKRNGAKQPSPLLNHLAFGSYNKKILKPDTTYDWLSRDKQEVEKYRNDPYSGFIPTASFFYDLFTGFDLIRDNNSFATIRSDLPMLFVSGDQDPVGNYTVGVKKVIERFKQHGLQDIEYVFYKEGRHEMLNEINKEEVFHDIFQWTNRVM